MQRLRRRIAFEVRQPLPPRGRTFADLFNPPLAAIQMLKLPQRHEMYCPLIGRVLDLLSAHAGSVSETAAEMGVTTGQLVRFLQRDQELLACVNRMRQACGLCRLGADQG